MLKRIVFVLAVLMLGTSIVPAQVSVAPLPIPKVQFLNGVGKPLAWGRVCTYASGGSTPLATYTDNTGSTPNATCATPTTGGIILDSGGFGNIWLGPYSYKIVLQDSTRAVVWTVDGVNSPTGALTIAGLTVTGNLAVTGSSVFTGPITGNAKILNNIRYCDQFTGANAGAKIAACIADLPSTGGTADARAFEGAQTITSDPFAGVTKPGTLVLGNATFLTTVPINLPSNWTIWAYGATLQTTNPTTFQPLNIIGTSGTHKTDVNVYGLKIDSQSSPQNTGNSGIRISYADRIKIRDCKVVGVGWEGIYVDAEGTFIWIEQNTISGVQGDGIHLGDGVATGTVTDVWVTENEVMDSYDDGIGMTGPPGGGAISPYRLHILNNIIDGTTIGAGIDIAGVHDFLIRGNTIRRYGQHGIRALNNLGSDSYNGVIEDNLIYAAPPANQPITLISPNSSHTTSPFLIRRNFIQTGNGVGAYLDGNAIAFEQNWVEATGAASRGVALDGTAGDPSNNTLIRNNIFRGMDTAIANGGNSNLGTVKVIENSYIGVTTQIDDPTKISQRFDPEAVLNAFNFDGADFIVGRHHNSGGGDSETYNLILRSSGNASNKDYEGQLRAVVGDGIHPSNSGVGIYASHFNGATYDDRLVGTFRNDLTLITGRFQAGSGTPLVAGDFALSGGWGSTASVGSLRGNDQFFEFVVTSAGTGQGASPTVTFTPHDGTWTTVPVWICGRQEFTSQPTVPFAVTTEAANSLVLTFGGTPVSAEAYVVACHTGGI